MINDIFFSIIIFIEFFSIVAFIVGLFLIIFLNKEPYKLIAKKLLIYSTIAFIIGFGCCVGGLLLIN
ncbi:hypothetical protein BWK58_15270 [Flavobacterium columnare]|uniref:hypothetical protein n=1 Tax=Flavobacterium oreochromis TaxID=2906078 RepID=UPI000CDA6DBC|nr:hypothetical protein BWK58_15270 [Flavobacterium columnare]